MSKPKCPVCMGSGQTKEDDEMVVCVVCVDNPEYDSIGDPSEDVCREAERRVAKLALDRLDSMLKELGPRSGFYAGVLNARSCVDLAFREAGIDLGAEEEKDDE